jgi:hypothetical protein
MATYYRLLDPEHENMIVKTEDKVQHRYEPNKGWIRTGIMLDYLWPESDTYDRYEEITEENAMQMISNN